jgi:transposase
MDCSLARASPSLRSSDGDARPRCSIVFGSPGRAAIGTGDGFSKGRDFAAWLGLVPKQISNGRPHHSRQHIEAGNRYLRVLFVQAAWVVLVRVNQNRWQGHGLKPWIEAAKKRLHHNVLAIALANSWRALHGAFLLVVEPSKLASFQSR